MTSNSEETTYLRRRKTAYAHTQLETCPLQAVTSHPCRQAVLQLCLKMRGAARTAAVSSMTQPSDITNIAWRGSSSSTSEIVASHMRLTKWLAMAMVALLMTKRMASFKETKILLWILNSILTNFMTSWTSSSLTNPKHSNPKKTTAQQPQVLTSMSLLTPKTKAFWVKSKETLIMCMKMSETQVVVARASSTTTRWIQLIIQLLRRTSFTIFRMTIASLAPNNSMSAA